MNGLRKPAITAFIIASVLLVLFSACNKKTAVTTNVLPANPLADSCGDSLALNYTAGGGTCTPCRYAISNYTGRYAVTDTYVYIDYYGTTEDRWDTSYFFDTVTVLKITGNTIAFTRLLTIQGLDSSNAQTVNTHYTDSLPYRHSSYYSSSSGYYYCYKRYDAFGVFRHDSLFYQHESVGTSMTDNFKHFGKGIRVN